MYRREEMCIQGFWWGNLKEKDHLENPGVDGTIILRKIFKKWDVRAWTGSTWLRIGTGAGTCKRSNEPWVSIKCEEYLVKNRFASQEGLCSVD
jgi:hypothetical protein